MRRPGRRATIAAGLVVVVAGAGSAVALAAGGGEDPSGTSTSTGEAAEVERRDLVVTDSYDGQLGYGEAREHASARAGVVTAVADPAATVAVGEALFSIDLEPTIVLAGSVPAYRALDSAATDGPDVQQLEQALVDLGHGSGVTVDEDFDARTAAAVARWEDALGRAEPDGRVELGDVVFTPGPVRVATVVADVGTRVQEGSTVVEATSTDHVVTVDLDSSRSDEMEPGTAVGLTLPDGTETTGTVTSIGSPEAAEDDPGGEAPGGGGGTTVPVTITLTDPAEAAAFDTGTVEVAIERQRDDGATAVPVEALLALVEGGYAVELVDGRASRLVAVEVGTYADGWVGVTGEGVEPGDRVVVPG